MPKSNFVDVFVGDTLKSASTLNLGPKKYKVRILRNGLPVKDTSFVLKAVNPFKFALNLTDTAFCSGGKATIFGKLTPDSTASYVGTGAIQATGKSIVTGDSGKYFLTATTKNSGCVLKDTAHVSVNEAPFLSIPDYLNVCKKDTNLVAVLNTGDQGTWRRIGGSAVIAQASNPTTRVTGLSGFRPSLNGGKGDPVNRFEWTVKRGGCTLKDTLPVYLADSIKTIADSKVGYLGVPIEIKVLQNDIFSKGEIFKNLQAQFNSQNGASIIDSVYTTGDTSVWVVIDRKLKGEALYTFTYSFVNGCGAKSGLQTLTVSAKNVRPVYADSIQYITLSPSEPQKRIQLRVGDLDTNRFIARVEPMSQTLPNGAVISLEFNSDSTVLTFTVDYSRATRSNQVYTANFRLFDQDSLSSEIILRINAEQSLGLVFYNGLSPNGDGKNDVFEIDNLDPALDNYLQVFNRWGDKVYEANHYNNITVAFDGGNLPDGTYYYVFQQEKGKKQIEGFILLKR